MNVRASFPIAAAAALVAFTFPAAARALDHIPFTDAAGLIQVQASVDGRPPVSMLVDTGAGVNTVSGRLGSLVFGADHTYATMRTNGQRVDLRMGNVVSITIGEYKLSDLNVAIWNGLEANGTDGLISAMAFKDVATTIDYRNHDIIVEDAPSFAERKRTGMWSPMILKDDRGIALELFAWFDFAGGKKGLCRIDTGSATITLDRKFAASIGATTTLPSLALSQAAGSVMKNLPATIGDSTYDCDVGNSFFANRWLSIDVMNRAMFVGIGP